MAKGKFSGSAVKRAGGIMAAVQAGCQTIAGQIRRLEASIARQERNLASAEARLKKMQGQPKPDQQAIKQLTAVIAGMQRELKTSNANLSQARDDFSFFCSG